MDTCFQPMQRLVPDPEAYFRDQKHDGWQHAANICAAIGARQCTVAELQAEETRWSGCQHDLEFVWTGEPCDDVTVGTAGADAHWTAMGGNHCGAGGCGNGGCQDTGEW